MEKLNIKIFQVNRLAFTAAKKEYIICILLYLLMSGNVFLNLYYSEYNMNLAYDLLNRKITFANSAIGIAGFTIGMICFSILDTIKKYVENKLILKFSYNIEYNLDEPTASVDPIQEMELLANFRNNIENKTAILISHRIGFAKLADRIYFMENGEIIESGSHEQLLQTKGRYYELYENQKMIYEAQ